MKYRFTALLIAVTLAVISLGSFAAAEEKLEVHLGDQPSFFILKIADHNGYFTEEFEGTNISIVVDNFVNQGSAIVEAMNAGDVQLGVIGTMPLVTADASRPWPA